MQDKYPLPYIAPLLSLSFMVPEGSEGLLKAMYTWVPSLGSQLAFFFHADNGALTSNDLHCSSSLPGACTMVLNLSLSVQVFWM